MSGRGAERVLRIIEWMAGELEPVSLTDVVSALGMPKSSTLDLLRLLVGAGYVERLANGRYRLSRLPGEARLGNPAWGALMRYAETPLRRAVDATGESGFVAVLDEGNAIRYLCKFLPRREIRYDRDTSLARLAHQVASGVVLLGRFDETWLRDYAARERDAGRLDGDVEPFIDKVRAAREVGYHFNEIGAIEGAGGMAAPIRDRDGEIIAALNISGPASRLARNAPTVRDATVACAREISGLLGFRETPGARQHD